MASHDSLKRPLDGHSRPAVPAVSLPRGGGAIRGMGEKFAANPVTGTSSLSIPLATSPGRSGFGPSLSLLYDSGAGNGPFGFGWSLSLPAITRKTDKGLPQYRDAEESDIFILSGAEDLVPVLQADGTRFRDETSAPGFVIHRYRPRIEGLFARIERWTRADTGETHWRSITPDNVTTLYGKDDASRIVDAAGAGAARPTGVFSWLPCESYDDKGNALVFEYAAEDDANVDRGQANERNRSRSAGRYVKRVRYGNLVSRLIQPDLSQASWLFEVVFDYDEGHYDDVPLDPARAEDEQHRFARASASPAQPWTVRPDPFSMHRPGFEVRSYRRCRRVLMFHHIPDLPTGEPGYDGLVRSTEFDYADLDYTQPVAIDDELAHQGSTRFASFIRSVTQSGYFRDDTQPVVVHHGVPYATYLKRSLPPLEFEYSKAVIQDEVHELDPASLENLPAGLAGAVHHWVDLDGEGVSGILTEQAGSWFYKANLGDGRFGPIESVALKPSLAALSGGRQQLVDLAGDGQLDLAAFASPTSGFYERTLDAGWEPFRAFPELPNAAWDDPNLRFVDLSGDGRTDVLIAENAVFTWHLSLAEDGFGPACTVRQPTDEERGPRLVFADGEQSVYLADMCGDGLTDLVRIRNGEVCYWPNLGYGRFGPKVTMDNAPRLDRPDRFEQARVRLADIDGSGTNDLIYLGHDDVRVYFNQSGNRWSEARPLPQFPHLNNVASVVAADLLGNGTGCLVWSSPLPGDAARPLRYVDLMGGTKPHLLVKTVNNLGAENVVRYAPSTRFYLADKRDGRPWITRLPFPVHVVERVETYDRISGNRFVTRHAYHHGHFDGVEREFRGFGLVEQWDTEEFAALEAGGEFPTGTNVDASSHVPPVYTRTWFHTGVCLERAPVSDHFAGEYYREPGLGPAEARALLLDDTVLPNGLTAREEREACRALKGSMLRREVYALDGTAKEAHPYTVTEQNFTVRVLQRQGVNRYAVFLTHAREVLQCHYERDPADPRVSHALTLEVNEFGDVLTSAAVGYGRRTPDPSLAPADQAKQEQPLITYVVHRYTNAVDAADAYRTPLPAEARTFELTGLAPSSGAGRFTFGEILATGATATPIDYEQAPTPGATEKRLIEHVRTVYRRNDLASALPLGTVESRALPFESYSLALTPGLVAAVYGGRVTDAMLADEGRYAQVQGDANWWIPSGQMFYSPGSADSAAQELAVAREHFFLPRRFRDPFHTSAVSTETLVTYDRYGLLVQETRDALGNRVTAGERNADPALPPLRLSHDYRVLQPAVAMDPNRNRAAVVFDALGMVAGTAVMGKPEESPVPGDRFTPAFRADLTQSEIDQLLADPKGPAAEALLDEASTRVVYDLDAHRRDPAGRSPTLAAALARETHASDPVPVGGLRIQASLSYSDGFAREIQKKLQAEPGPTPRRDAAGAILVGADGQPEMTTTVTSPRWVGSGWTVFNNKGKPVRQYEPFFSDTHRFELDVRIGVSPVLCYDPLTRVVATLHPNHAWDKVLFDPWREERWDVNDTVLLDPAQDDVAEPFVRRLPDAEYLPTWHDRRVGGALGAAEQDAAAKTAVHAGTPSLVHADSLGRTFVTVAHNRFKRNGALVNERYATRVVLDVEGNQREVHDANDRLVMRYDYDMLGTVIRQASMEAGDRWTLRDVGGTAIRAWNSREHQFRTRCDRLRRPVESYVREGNGPERLFARTVHGDTEPNAEATNLRGKVVRHFDQAGVITSDRYDFKGNLLRSSRQLAREYKQTLDWALVAVDLEPETFTTTTTYDALNRPTAVTAPDQSLYRPAFNEANLLEAVDVALRGAQTATSFVTDIDYDAKGRREMIAYGNGATTRYRYDPLTSRLTSLTTTRAAGQARLQDFSYTYDPTGNVTRLEDGAQQTVYFDNQVAQPRWDYSYDAVYRLIAADGREHAGQASRPEPTWDDVGRVKLPHPGDAQAMRPYTERYEYDAVGNFLRMIHQATGSGGWTRAYAYEEPSLLEAGRRNNRLSRVTIGAGPPELYVYDAHGNTTAMPHLTLMAWDFEDQLHASARQAVSSGAPETTYYVYDAAGQRVRKVTELPGGARKDERLYLSGFEVFRRYGTGGVVALERETLHVMDDKQRIALVERRTQGADGSPPQLIRYQFGNHLGSAALELTATGEIISYEEYFPYGSTSYQAGPNAVEVSFKRYRYTGMERDEETGFNYHGARYYVPWLARWASADPVGIQDDLNLFAYVHDNPLMLVDSSGTDGKPALPPAQDWHSDAFGDIPDDLPFRSAVIKPEPECVQGEEGPRGEFLRKKGENRPPPTKYTKPKAIDAAARGNYEAAELYEHYMCPSCHVTAQVGHTPSDAEFSLKGYVTAYQNNYKTGALLLATAAFQGFMLLNAPRLLAVIGSYEAGVSGVEAFRGRSSGAHLTDLAKSAVTQNIDSGRKLSTPERIGAGVDAVLFTVTAAAAAVRSRYGYYGYLLLDDEFRPIKAGISSQAFSRRFGQYGRARGDWAAEARDRVTWGAVATRRTSRYQAHLWETEQNFLNRDNPLWINRRINTTSEMKGGLKFYDVVGRDRIDIRPERYLLAPWRR
jgi:RHS repeat-associated protein